MRLNEAYVRRIINQELELVLHERASIDEILTPSDIRFLRIAEARARTLNEDFVTDILVTVGMNLLFSKMGRSLMIIVLKGIRGFADWQLKPMVEVPKWVWMKAYNYLKEKTGISLPITPADVFDFMSYAIPHKWLSLASNELIKLLEDTTDEEFQEAVAPGKKKLPGKDKEKLPGKDKEKPSDKSDRKPNTSKSDNSNVIDAEWEPVEPKRIAKISESRMRAIIRSELAKLG